MKNQSVPQNLAVIVDRNGTYQSAVLAGVKDFLRTVGWSETLFYGQELNFQSRQHSNASQIYSLINPKNHAGILFLAGTVGNSCSNPQLLEFLQGFQPLPVVSFGRKLPQIPSVLTDNTQGMRELMEHLILTLGLKRFCFIRGRLNNPQSQEREMTVRNSLFEHGLSLPEDFVLTGNFEARTAQKVFLEFLESHPNSVDCVICANDDMAQAVIKTLSEQGFRVPEEIAVTGFDDVSESQYTLPLLTTVRQPLFEQGVAAARILYNIVHGLPYETDLTGNSTLVVRESCGGSLRVQEQDFAVPKFEKLSARERALYHQFVDSLDQTDLSFVHQMKNCFESDLKQNQELEVWYSILQTWRQKAKLELSIENLIKFEARSTMIGGVLVKTMQTATRLVKAGRQVHTTNNNQIAVSLSGHETLETLMQDLQTNLNGLGLNNYLVVLYEEFGLQPSASARVWIQKSSANPGMGQTFKTQALLPESMLDVLSEGTCNIYPLFVHEEHYGYILLNHPDQWGYDGERLAYLIGQGIHRVVKTQALKQYSERLEQQVRIRTEQIEQANLELKRSLLLDGLTGIYNRSAFDDYLQRMWQQHYKSQEPLSLLMCDVDFFKKYNDRYGHLQGDHCLQFVAKAIAESAPRPDDFVARYGGEEFVVVLPETNAIGAMRVAERIQKQITQLCLPHQGLDSFEIVTLSIGIQTMIPSDKTSMQDLMQSSDMALYAAKQNRNQIVASRAWGVQPN